MMMADGVLSVVMQGKLEGNNMGFGNFLLDIAKKKATDTLSSMKETQKFVDEYDEYQTETLMAEYKKTSDINRKRAIAVIIGRRRKSK